MSDLTMTSRRAAGAWAVAISVVLSQLAGCSKEAAEPARRAGGDAPSNVLLITLDTTRADALGCYGNQIVRTPALDGLAAEGVLFTQCMTCVPITLPSHASILTGTYPFVHGARVNGRPLADAPNVTLAEILKKANYDTGAEVGAFVLDPVWGISQGFDSFRAPGEAQAADSRKRGPGNRPTELIAAQPADQVCNRAIEWLDEHGAGRFFLWVHFWDPHHPYAPPEPFKSRYPKDPYLGEVAFADQQVGRLLDRLKALGLDGKTLVIAVGDHGEAFADHREGTHMYYVYDSTMRVPLLMRCPGRFPAGRRVNAQVRTVDITPTVLDLLGLAEKPDAQGVSLAPLLTGAKADLDLAAYGETMSPYLDLRYAQLRCLRIGDWKYIHAPTPELYNVAEDPGELVNLAPSHPDLVAHLREQLRSVIADSAPSGAASGPTLLDQETADRLASLGYASGIAVDGIDDELRGFDDLKGPDPKDRIDLHIKFQMARAYALEDAHDKAAELLEALANEDPGNPSVFVNLATQERALGRLEEAVTAYRHLLELKYQVGTTRLQLGRLLGEMGRIEEATGYLQEAVRDLPDHPDAQAALALALVKQGKLPAAAARFEQALELDPSHEDACLGLSQVLQASGRAADAAAVLREGLKHRPGSTKLANNLAWLLATASDAAVRNGAEAVRLATSITDGTQVEDPEILDTLAAAYASVGRMMDAVSTAQKALELASSLDRPDLEAGIRSRLALYESGQAYYEGTGDE